MGKSIGTLERALSFVPAPTAVAIESEREGLPSGCPRQTMSPKATISDDCSRDVQGERADELRCKADGVSKELRQKAQQQRCVEAEMAENYRAFLKSRAEDSKAERQKRLLDLSSSAASSSRPVSQRASTRSLDSDEDGHEDLFARYGHKIRVPRPPSSDAPDHSSWRAGRASAQRKQPASQASKYAASEEVDTKRQSQSTQVRRRGDQVSGCGGAGAGSRRQSLCSDKPSRPLPKLRVTKFEPPPEPDSALMQRKILLRKEQQALLKKTEVSFYKVSLKRRLKKILQAVECTFTDGRDHGESLAKPLTMAEVEQAAAIAMCCH